jgi:hypothetical protein
MPGVSARVLWVGLAVAGIGGALDGCGGKLVADPGGGGNGGTNAAAGTTGSGGTASGGTASGGTAFGEPACVSALATKAASCTPADQQFCYKACGPEKQGGKSETCTNGIYYEMPGCAFDPDKDYSCYAIPNAANPVCPQQVTLQAGTPCQVDHCVPCNSSGGLPGGMYTDSSGAPKVGYCVCQPPNAAGERTWSCASDTAWPCPLGIGCGSTKGAGGTTGVTGTGGTTGTAGTDGMPATTGTGGMPGGGAFGQPACLSSVAKGASCTSADQQFCYKGCGPALKGIKSETCLSGVYVEMSGCTFDPAVDYSCYKISFVANAACPSSVVPMAGAPCEVQPCLLCNSIQGVPAGQYLDVSGATRVGYCVCQPPDAAGLQKWSCASNTSWPCPAGAGC